jgi:hypothetical protein
LLLKIWCVPSGQYNQQTVLLLAKISNQVRSYWSIPKGECAHYREFGSCEALLVFVVLNQQTALLLAMSRRVLIGQCLEASVLNAESFDLVLCFQVSLAKSSDHWCVPIGQYLKASALITGTESLDLVWFSLFMLV